MTNKKVLAVASVGGHWIQLLRIVQTFKSDIVVVYAATHSKCQSMVDGYKFYTLQDFSRWDFYKIVPVFFKALKLIWSESPNTVITTGAAPGLIL
jgi:hypothetical protein